MQASARADATTPAGFLDRLASVMDAFEVSGQLRELPACLVRRCIACSSSSSPRSGSGGMALITALESD